MTTNEDATPGQDHDPSHDNVYSAMTRGVGVVFASRDLTEILIQEKEGFGHRSGMLTTFGGGIEDGEDPRDAAIRECLKEEFPLLGGQPHYWLKELLEALPAEPTVKEQMPKPDGEDRFWQCWYVIWLEPENFRRLVQLFYRTTPTHVREGLPFRLSRALFDRLERLRDHPLFFPGHANFYRRLFDGKIS